MAAMSLEASKVFATDIASRRRLLAALPWAFALSAALPRKAHALGADATGDLLRSRLAMQGVGLVAVQVEGGERSLIARGDARAGVPLRDDALFEIGSLTKTFTALLLADAVVRGELALDGAVEDALPDLRLRDPAGRPLRWIDLATHRSGLPRLPANLVPREPADPYAAYGEADLVAFLRAFTPVVERDARWEYSNLGFGLLGHALGRRAGVGFSELLATRVLKPLGLTTAAIAAPGRTIERLVDGHDAERRVVAHWRFDDAMAGAGGLVMSGGDIARYLAAALDPAPTAPLAPAFALALRRQAAGPVAMSAMALAWIRVPLAGRTVLIHDGRTFGFSSSTWLDPDRRRGVSVLANAGVAFDDLAAHLLDPSVPLRPAPPSASASAPAK